MNFNLIVVLSKNYAIQNSNDTSSPLAIGEYFEHFKDFTKDDVVVMGRSCFESLPLTKRPLGDAINVVLSRNYPKYQFEQNDRLIFTNVFNLNNQIVPEYSGKQFWVVGGLSTYSSLLGLCQNLTIIHQDVNISNPSMFFVDVLPSYELQAYTDKKWSDTNKCHYRILHYKKNMNSPSLKHESQYLDTLSNLVLSGQARDDRTGVGTIGSFGGQQEYDVSQYLPILTTKLVPLSVIIKELLWFLGGSTDAKVLQSQGVHIWDGNTTRDFLDKRGLHHYEIGDIGAGYGFQWRHFSAEYEGCDKDYAGKGFDQIEYVLDLLKNDPFSRRIVINSWNPADLKKTALPPCHILFQLYVEEDPDTHVRYMSGHLYQRSSDYFLAANYNLVSYTILLYILCKKVGYYPKKMFMSFGDIHIYKNHTTQVQTQLGRQPRPQPILNLSDSIADKQLNEISVDDFELIGYFPQPAIRAPMAV